MSQFLWDKEVKQAHIAGSYAIAFEAAVEDLDGLTLPKALELVFEAARGQDPLYADALALTWLDQGILERRFTLYQAGWAAHRLHDLGDWRERPSAEASLRRFVS